MPKRFLVFREPFGGILSHYEWNEEKQWWLKEDGNGFSLETVNQYKDGRAFTQFDTIEEVEEHYKYTKYATRHGARVKKDPDFACPVCGYHFEDQRDFEGYGDYPTDPINVKCYCGHKFTVQTRMVYVIED